MVPELDPAAPELDPVVPEPDPVVPELEPVVVPELDPVVPELEPAVPDELELAVPELVPELDTPPELPEDPVLASEFWSELESELPHAASVSARDGTTRTQPRRVKEDDGFIIFLGSEPSCQTESRPGTKVRCYTRLGDSAEMTPAWKS